MKVMWAPWRMEYILGPKADACPFCIPDTSDDAERLIVHRGSRVFVLMNKFPYNNGHMMVTPYRHVMHLEDLDLEESQEMMGLITLSAKVLKEYCSPEGINVGINLGQAAGAGIAGHLHCHLVPRWTGDSSFLAVMDEVRTIPQHLQKTYLNIVEIFKKLVG